MAERKAEKCPTRQRSIGDRIMPPTAVLKTYDNNRIERFTEELEDMKAKLLKSEKENARLTEELEDMKAKLLKSEKENARLTEELEDMKAKLLKSEKENASLIKDFEEKIMPGSSPEGLNDDLVTRERERNSRASPATKEDVQTIIELLSTSLKLPHERQREELTRQKEGLTAFLQENSRLKDEVDELRQQVLQYEQKNIKLVTECSEVTRHNSHLAIQLRQQKQKSREKREKLKEQVLLKDQLTTKLSETVTEQYSRLSVQLQQLQKNDYRCQHAASRCAHIHAEHERMHAALYSAECQRPECVQMTSKRITELEEELKKAKAQFNKLDLNRRMAQQHDSIHDQLNVEYEELWSNPEIILEQLEEHFDDPFDAKCFLADFFMDAYEKSKRYLMDLSLRQCNMEELYKVQSEKGQKVEMEGLSRAYGLFLQFCGIKTQKETVTKICNEVKSNIEKMPQFSKAKNIDLEKIRLPLDKVVEVAWKFVTQANPIIACVPKQFNEELHRPSFNHWDEEQGDSRPLIYAKPVVYRSYHGPVMNTALVGNKI
jgi:hypothetical protein